MICDIIQTAVEINNKFNINTIPYSFLTRQEDESLMAINKLDRLRLDTSENLIQPFKELTLEDSLKLKYQPLCKSHLQALIEKEKIGNYIYISMTHVKNMVKEYKDFYNSEFYSHLHIVLELYHWDDESIYVKPTNLNRSEYLKHLEIARVKERDYNLKYNLKKYIYCPCCVATLTSLTLYYTENMGCLPKKLAQIPDDFENALVLIKNDRINIELVCTEAKNKWKCENMEQYFTKLNNICKCKNWEYDKIIMYIHKNHYTILKNCERIRDKNSNADSWKVDRNLNNSWRSNIKVA